MVQTYSQFANRSASEKITLAHLHMKRQVYTFTQITNSQVWTRNPAYWVVGVELEGEVLTEVTGTPALGQFSYNGSTNLLSIFTNGTITDQEVILEYRLFVSDRQVSASYNLVTGGETVDYKPLIRNIPGFTTSLGFSNNNKTIVGSGNLELDNPDKLFNTLLAQYRFENKEFVAYSWNPKLAFSENRVIYRGAVGKISFRSGRVTFGMKDNLFQLNNEIPVTQFTASEVIASHTSRFKKKIFGRVNGMAVQSISQIGDGYSITGTISGQSVTNVITGTGTSFLTEIAPGDKINVVGLSLTVKDVVDNEYLTIGEELSNLFNNVSATVSPSSPWYNTNRTFSVADHPLKQFSTTIVSFLDRARLQVADSSIFEVGDDVVINDEIYGIFRVSQTPTIPNVIVLDRTLSGNNLPVIGATVVKREVQDVKLKGLSLVTTDFSITNANNTEPSIILDADAEQNITPEFSTPSDVTYINGSEYIIVGTPAVQRVTESASGNYIGTSIQLSSETMLDRFVWVSYEGMVPREFARESAQNVSFRRGEVYFNTGDETFYGFRAATDGEGSNDGTTGEVDLGSDPVIAFVENQETNPLNFQTPSNTSFSETGVALKRAIDPAGTLWFFSNQLSEWILHTNQGINTPLQNAIVANGPTFATNTFVQGSLPQLDYDFSNFLKARSFIRIPTLSETFQVISASSKNAKLSSVFTNVASTFAEISAYRNPDYITDTSLVTVSAFGQTEDNTITGDFIKTPADAMKKVLIDNGLTDFIDASSFTGEDIFAGIYVPYSLTTTGPDVIDFINKMTISTLGSIGLDNDFRIKLQLLNGANPGSIDNLRVIRDSEVVGRITQDINQSSLFKYTLTNIQSNYNFGEDDPESDFIRLEDAKIRRLTDLDVTETIDLYLPNASEAEAITNRYLGYNQRINTIMSFQGALSLQDIVIGQIVLLDFIEFRTVTPFLGMVLGMTRNGSNIHLRVANFGDLYVDAAVYTDNDAPTFASSNSNQKLLHAFYTDNNGLIDGDEDTQGESVYV